MSQFTVNQVWPIAFKRGERKSTCNNRLEEWFCSSERYPMDFNFCGMKSDWYQFDTAQDAPYYGSWCNPRLLMLLSYTEGDIYLIHCETPDQYRAEIEALEKFNAEYESMSLEDWRKRGRYGIDDHDSFHWDKLLHSTLTESEAKR